jgi:hypothetical protein
MAEQQTTEAEAMNTLIIAAGILSAIAAIWFYGRKASSDIIEKEAAARPKRVRTAEEINEQRQRMREIAEKIRSF